MIIRSRKFKVNKPITIEGEFELTTMTGIPGLIISTDEDHKVTAHPVEENDDKRPDQQTDRAS